MERVEKGEHLGIVNDDGHAAVMMPADDEILKMYRDNNNEEHENFLDTADTEVIRKYFQTGLIDGVTTNPTLIRKSGRDPEDVYAEMDEIGKIEHGSHG